jgi:ubiquinone biosynthesis protein UbiJ
MIDEFASSAAVALLNRLLARETWARHKLAPYAGRVARIEALPFVLSLRITEGGSFAAEQGEPSVTVTVESAALPHALFDPQAVLRNVRLAGDAEFAQALSQVLQNLRPEPEEELARFVGDAAAVRIVGFLRAAFSQARENTQRLATTAADYFIAENPMLVARDEVESFSREVARLRDDVERMAKRVEMLERRG